MRDLAGKYGVVQEEDDWEGVSNYEKMFFSEEKKIYTCYYSAKKE